MKDITREDIIDKLNELQGLSTIDAEVAHIRADELLCDILQSLGYNDIVEEFDKIKKWYS